MQMETNKSFLRLIYYMPVFCKHTFWVGYPHCGNWQHGNTTCNHFCMHDTGKFTTWDILVASHLEYIRVPVGFKEHTRLHALFHHTCFGQIT
jgi:hypothetical protein